MYFLNIFFFIICINSAQCANILGVFVIPSVSHQVVFQPIWRELSLRGHKVTVITPNPLNDPSLTNLTEIDVKFVYEIIQNYELHNYLFKDSNVFQNHHNLFKLIDLVVDSEFNSTAVKNLINDRKANFDLILIEMFHPTLFALSKRFKAPAIGVLSLGAFTIHHQIVGNPTHPVLYPDTFLSFKMKNWTLWDKIRSVFFNLWSRYYHYNVFVPQAQKMAQKYFGDNISDVGELEKNISMLFINENFIIYPPRPYVPTVVELGQMNIKPVKALPKDLQKILDESKEGVIYFSLGTNVKCVSLGENLIKIITEALSELPYKILFKWEEDHLPRKPSNVIIKKWLPQQDILAHPNIRVFVTQGGFQSMEEAIARGVPIVGIPFIVDQPLNVQRAVDIGIGLSLNPVTLTKEDLKKTIIEVAENSAYKQKILEVRKILFDKPMTGLEKAVWWSEYVIRHKGAIHLRSQSANISWFDYLILDVWFTFIFIALIIAYSSYRLISWTQRKNKLKYL